MELIDDYKSVSQLSEREKLALIIKNQRAFDDMKKDIKTANTIMKVIGGFSVLGLISLFMQTPDAFVWIFTIMLILFFIIAPFQSMKYARVYLLIASIFIGLNILVSLINFSPLSILVLIIQGTFLVYMIKGFIASRKYNEITNNLKGLNVKYNDMPS